MMLIVMLRTLLRLTKTIKMLIVKDKNMIET